MSVYLLVSALHLDFCRFPWIPVDKLFVLLSKANPPFSFRTWLEQICPFSPGSLIFPSLNGQLHAVVLKRAVHATIVKFSVDPPISLTLLHFSVPLYRIKCPQKSYLCPSYSRPRSSSFQLDLCPTPPKLLLSRSQMSSLLLKPVVFESSLYLPAGFFHSSPLTLLEILITCAF